jgi:hypothetical protein
VLLQQKNAWYVAPRMTGDLNDWPGRYKEAAKPVIRDLDAFRDETRRLRKRVESGELNRDNFDRTMADLKARAASQADTDAPTESSP